jgi:hypothetical protein
MRLVDLEPQFLARTDDRHFHYVDTIAEADGLIFVCPKCFAANGFKRPGVHSIICWAPSVPQTTSPTPGRWSLLGTGFADLTLVAGSDSVLLTGEGCAAHFYVRDGAIVDA